MIHRTLIFLLCLMMLDIVTVPVDDRSPLREVRGQTEQEREDAGESGPASEGGIVNLQGSISIVDLIMAVSEINDEVYVIDSSVRPNEISIVTPGGGMKKEDLLGLFDTVLRLNGLAVVKADGINKIVNTSDIKGANTPVESGGQK
jgi:type II secretory pathway component GspD/PulD (secretin)